MLKKYCFFILAITVSLFFSCQITHCSQTNIPQEAWSRDINAGGYVDGAPIGGFGAGTVTWCFDGSFYKDRLDIAKMGKRKDENMGFYMYQKSTGQKVFFKRLNAASLGSGNAAYYALFPKAWVNYYGKMFTCKTKVTQYSPIIPYNYQTTSFPVGIYQWEIKNPTSKPCEIAIMFTLKNDYGGKNALSTTRGNNQGLVLTSGIKNPRSPFIGEFALASQKGQGVEITYTSAPNLTDIQADFSQDGLLNNKCASSSLGGLAFKVCLKAGEVKTVPIVLAWDIPIARPGITEGNSWYRKYTRFYGKSGTNAWRLADDALNNYQNWNNSISKWQNSIINNRKYPSWLKTTIFNELYYCFTGGTIWEAGAAGGQKDNPDEDMFSYLETYAYPFYGTSDVYFYGSWPLVMLWPDIDKQCVRQYCDSIVNNKPDRPRALGTCAHDLGSPGSEFSVYNEYAYRDTTEWKDLNAKLVLMVYRDWALTGKKDQAFLNYCWNSVKTAMEKIKSQDTDGDGLPDSSGADQTYDNLEMRGATSYCGGLFLAACEAAQELAQTMGDTKRSVDYQSWLAKGKRNFEQKLWTGAFYRIDTGSTIPERIMSDQLCGHWYAKACGLPGIVSGEHAKRSFLTIFENNYKRFDHGQHGIVNVIDHGKINRLSEQSCEMWVGTAWGVVAGMVQEKMYKEADQVGYSIYKTIYHTKQFWFRTPEAWNGNDLYFIPGSFRGVFYMRPNAVWAVKHAYDLSH